MIGQSMVDALGDGIEGMIGTMPGGQSAGAQMWESVAAAAGLALDGPFRGEAYDAAALILSTPR